MRPFLFATGIAVGLTLSAIVAAAWTGPTSSPPNNNASAPVNVGTTDQVKNGGLGVNALAVFGDALIQTDGHLNFGTTSGDSGYGFRDDNGIMEYKDNGDANWTAFSSLGSNASTSTNSSSINWSNPEYYNASASYDQVVNTGVHTLCVLSLAGEGSGCGRCNVYRNNNGTWSVDEASCSDSSYEWCQATCYDD